jgi:hypothetical protein
MGTKNYRTREPAHLEPADAITECAELNALDYAQQTGVYRRTGFQFLTGDGKHRKPGVFKMALIAFPGKNRVVFHPEASSQNSWLQPLYPVK